MNPFRIVVAVTLALATSATCVLAQGGGSFDLSAYEAFLQRNTGLSAAGLAGMYPPGPFARSAPHVPSQAAFFRSVDSTFKLTATELALLADHGLTEACQRQPALKGGINVMNGQVTHKAVAEAHGLPCSAV